MMENFMGIACYCIKGKTHTNLLSTLKHRDLSPEIHKLAVMLPTYLVDSDLVEKIERID